MALVKKFSKVGNSVGMIFPSEFLNAAGLNLESEMEISFKENKIILEPTNMKDHKILKTFMGVLKDYDETFKKLAK